LGKTEASASFKAKQQFERRTFGIRSTKNHNLPHKQPRVGVTKTKRSGSSPRSEKRGNPEAVPSNRVFEETEGRKNGASSRRDAKRNKRNGVSRELGEKEKK